MTKERQFGSEKEPITSIISEKLLMHQLATEVPTMTSRTYVSDDEYLPDSPTALETLKRNNILTTYAKDDSEINGGKIPSYKQVAELSDKVIEAESEATYAFLTAKNTEKGSFDPAEANNFKDSMSELGATSGLFIMKEQGLALRILAREHNIPFNLNEYYERSSAENPMGPVDSKIESAFGRVRATSIAENNLVYVLKYLNLQANQQGEKILLDDLSRYRIGIENLTSDAITAAASRAVWSYAEERYGEGGTQSQLRPLSKLLRKSEQISPSGDWAMEDRGAVEFSTSILNSDRRLKLARETLAQLKLDSRIPVAMADHITNVRQHIEQQYHKRSKIIRLSPYEDLAVQHVPSNPEIFSLGGNVPVLYVDSSNKDPQENKTEDTADSNLEAVAYISTKEELRKQDQEERDKRLKQLEQQVEFETLLVEEIDAIKVRLQALVRPFRVQSGKYFRTIGITGSNSFEYQLQQSKLTSEDDFDSEIRTYEGLMKLAKSENPAQIYSELIATLNELRDQYKTLSKQVTLTKIEKDLNNIDPFLDDITWLSENWTQFISALKASRHSQYVDAPTLEKIRSLLILKNEPETILLDEATEEEQSNEWSAEELEELARMERDERNASVINNLELMEANHLAEQLDWVVLPDDVITSDDLIDRAKRTLSGNKSDKVVDEQRMKDLLEFRDLFGGELYRSSERMLGDSNNLYFVLKFENPDDKKTYAIAENVVFGNATYVIREDTMPLNPGESVLTAVTLSRKDIRDLGAKRIIHKQNVQKPHDIKVIEAIQQLSNITV